MISLFTAGQQIFWTIFLLPVTGWATVKCFFAGDPAGGDFACAALFTVWLLQLLETVVVVAVVWFLWWAGVRVFRRIRRPVPAPPPSKILP